MSQPMVSGVCTTAVSASPRSEPLSARISSPQNYRSHQHDYRQHQSHSHASSHKNIHSRLQGPTNTSNGLITNVSLASTSPPSTSSSFSATSSPKSASTSSFTSTSHHSSFDGTSRMPSRLISPNQTSAPSAPSIATTHVGSQETNGIVSKSKDAFSDNITSPAIPSLSEGLRASEVAVTSQPPPSSVPGYTKCSEPASTLKETCQEQSSVTAAPSSDESDNQIPTIAQRDALTSRVYSVCRSAGYSNWLHLLELAPLASQHHLSGYNCMKFGKQGSPYAYFPLTLQQPWQADAVTEKQKVSENEAMKWLIQKRKRKNKAQDYDRGVKRGGGILEEDGTRVKGTQSDEDAKSNVVGGNVKVARASSDENNTDDCEMQEASTLQDNEKGTEICDGDDEVEINGPLKDVIAVSQEFEEPIKKGEDCESIKSSSDEGESMSDSRQVTFEKNEQQTTLCTDGQQSAVKTSDSHPISISPMIPAELMINITRYVQAGLQGGGYQVENRDAVYEETTTTRHCELQLEGKRLIRCCTSRVDLWEIAQKAEKETVDASQMKRANRLLGMQPDLSRFPHGWMETVCLDEQTPENGDSDLIPVAFGGRYRGFTVGNLLLSSCPGKKVRLTGPVRGRGAICRNLGLDLKRIKQLGVGALVCCLDDEELAFLGAPWSEYEKEADLLGMDVVRLPMAEGFCPTDVATADNAMTSIVEHFTLKGINVLVHCRGGVGRAGLIACIWMLKLGLVRSDHDEEIFQENSRGSSSSIDVNQTSLGSGMPGQSGHSSDGGDASSDENKSEEIMQIIHRLIDTIRRRRSPKAIETAEQVSFLFKYVTFLHEQESQRRIRAG